MRIEIYCIVKLCWYLTYIRAERLQYIHKLKLYIMSDNVIENLQLRQNGAHQLSRL